MSLSAVHAIYTECEPYPPHVRLSRKVGDLRPRSGIAALLLPYYLMVAFLFVPKTRYLPLFTSTALSSR